MNNQRNKQAIAPAPACGSSDTWEQREHCVSFAIRVAVAFDARSAAPVVGDAEFIRFVGECKVVLRHVRHMFPLH
jgi:hypothetical protein